LVKAVPLSLAIIPSTNKLLGHHRIFLKPLPYDSLALLRGWLHRKRPEISTKFVVRDRSLATPTSGFDQKHQAISMEARRSSSLGLAFFGLA
jgi:hypothetical protein